MEKELFESLYSYKEITDKIIYELQKETYEELDDLFNKRQAIINKIQLLPYDVEMFRKICEKLDLLKSDNNLGELIKSKKEFVAGEIRKTSVNRNANKSYNKKFQVDSIFFNKKI